MGNAGMSVMRKRNWRLIAVGTVLLVLAVLFFLSMRDTTPWSNDPATVMRTVGEVSGAVGGISLVMILFGLIGRKAPA
jgi:multidrug resistance efflux pump